MKTLTRFLSLLALAQLLSLSVLAQTVAPVMPASGTVNINAVAPSGIMSILANGNFWQVLATVAAIAYGAWKHQKAAGLRAVLGETVKGIESSTALQPFENDVKSAIQKAVTDKLGANGEAILHAVVVSEAAPVRAAIDKALAAPPAAAPAALPSNPPAA